MYDKILCIYPIDPSTDFLDSIPNQLQKKFENIFELFRIDSSDESQSMAVYKMESCSDNTLVIFLGHGSTAGFHCYDVVAEGNIIFLNSQNIKRILKKNIFAFSCNSSIFLKKFSSNSNSWLGFDDLPTEDETFPIEFSQDEDKALFLDLYKRILIDAILFSLNELISTGSFSKSFSSLKLILNKNMIQLASNNSTVKNRELADLIFNTKRGIDFHECF